MQAQIAQTNFDPDLSNNSILKRGMISCLVLTLVACNAYPKLFEMLDDYHPTFSLVTPGVDLGFREMQMSTPHNLHSGDVQEVAGRRWVVVLSRCDQRQLRSSLHNTSRVLAAGMTCERPDAHSHTHHRSTNANNHKYNSDKI